jgi:iron(III) transport system ATP-binding protein
VVRPENLRIADKAENSIPMKIVCRYFEGDRIDYDVVLPGHEDRKPFSMSVPFLPGMTLTEQEATIEAAFTPEAGVVICK